MAIVTTVVKDTVYNAAGRRRIEYTAAENGRTVRRKMDVAPAAQFNINDHLADAGIQAKLASSLKRDELNEKVDRAQRGLAVPPASLDYNTRWEILQQVILECEDMRPQQLKRAKPYFDTLTDAQIRNNTHLTTNGVDKLRDLLLAASLHPKFDPTHEGEN